MNDIEVGHESDFVPESDKCSRYLRQSRHRQPPSRTEDNEVLTLGVYPLV